MSPISNTKRLNKNIKNRMTSNEILIADNSEKEVDQIINTQKKEVKNEDASEELQKKSSSEEH